MPVSGGLIASSLNISQTFIAAAAAADAAAVLGPADLQSTGLIVLMHEA